jgi:serine/threonine protein kinase
MPERNDKPRIIRYSLDTPIARGGMGSVWKGVDQRLGRTVAIKILNVDAINVDKAENFRRRFRREGCLTASLEHPGIVRLYDFGQTEEDLPYMVMEFVEGVTLTRKVEKSHPLSIDRVLRYLVQKCDALDYAHAKGMIHRDLKPDNVMIDRSDRVRVMDFGLARLKEDDDSFGVESWKLAERGVVLGSPGYMSPEQAYGRPVDARSDLFALGMIVYFMIAGRHPFTGDAQAIVTRTAKEPAPSFAEMGREVPIELETALRMSIELEPANRPPSVRQWWEEVRKAVKKTSIRAPS